MKTLRYGICLLIGLVSAENVVGQLSGYTVSFGLTNQKPRQVVLCHWTQNGQSMHWLVDPQTLETSVQAPPENAVQMRSWADLQRQLTNTPYGRAMRDEQQRDGPLQDAGLERTDTTERGFSLTIDLCPSTKPLTRSVFETLIRAFEPEEKPIRFPFLSRASGWRTTRLIWRT